MKETGGIMNFEDKKSQTYKVVAAFAAVYLIWGSTYLAARFGLESLPPFLMSGVRYLTAGGLLYFFARLRGASAPTLGQWGRATIIGFLLFVIGSGGVVLAQQWISSGMASLMVTTVPIFVVLIDWLRPGGNAPSKRIMLGLLAGMAGMGLLLSPGQGTAAVNLTGVAWVMLASLCWAAGSLYARTADLPQSKLQIAAMETLSAGLILLVISMVLGETNDFQLNQITLKSLCSLLYLIVFGSIIGFSAYVYLLKEASPSRVSTHAYVNPLVAVFLGWLLAGEKVTAQTLMAAAVIMCAVYLISRPSARKMVAQPVRVRNGHTQLELDLERERARELERECELEMQITSKAS